MMIVYSQSAFMVCEIFKKAPELNPEDARPIKTAYPFNTRKIPIDFSKN